MRDTAGETPALPFEEAAGLFAVQNTEWDAPWTDWSKMLQLHEEATSSAFAQRRMSEMKIRHN